jgi:peptidyl-prolyl cis-trans isomerase A (cyclophilin A)
MPDSDAPLKWDVRMRFFAFILLLASVTAPVAAIAQAVPTPPATAPARPAIVRVLLTTAAGPITLELEQERAPLTTANFLRYVDARRLDGMSFYRAMTLGPDSGLIQGGVRDPKLLYPPVAHEPTSQTGLRHDDATISMARGAPGSAAADFFITIGAIPSLDANSALPGDNLGFAAFGHVVDGMAVVRTILAAPTSPTAGEGVMKGQMIAEPVRILTARRITP